MPGAHREVFVVGPISLAPEPSVGVFSGLGRDYSGLDPTWPMSTQMGTFSGATPESPSADVGPRAGRTLRKTSLMPEIWSVCAAGSRCASRGKPMKSYRKELWFETPGRRAFSNITSQVEAALKESGVQEGLALVNAMHITASVFINDDERGLHADYDAWLERLAPHEPVSGYRHNRTGEDNADAHMKRQIMGRGGSGRDYGGQTRLRSLGADFLRRVRRRPPQARADQDHRRIAEKETMRLVPGAEIPGVEGVTGRPGRQRREAERSELSLDPATAERTQRS